MSIRDEILVMPWYDTHCHIGCLHNAGLYDEHAFLCDCVRGLELPEMDLPAVLEGSYMKWLFCSVRVNPDSLAHAAGFPDSLTWAREDPAAWWNANRPHYRRMETTGTVRTLVRGIRELHGIDLGFGEDEPFIEHNKRVRENYRREGFYSIWKKAFQRLNCVRAVKLVEMPWFDRPVANEEAWRAEQDLVVPALRVDSFTALHLPDERLSFRLRPELLGIDAPSLDDYLAQVDRCLDRAVAGGIRALKNAYAYFGPLRFAEPDPVSADRYVRRGNPEDYRAFEGAVLTHLMEWANQRGFPYQMHAGIVRIPWCDPTQLADYFDRYYGIRFVPLHIHPYEREAGCMAAWRGNVHLDPCWMGIMSPEVLRNAFREWIGIVPPEKIFCGIDTTTPEQWFGAAVMAKESLAAVLEEKIEQGLLDPDQALRTAKSILFDTASQWYE